MLGSSGNAGSLGSPPIYYFSPSNIETFRIVWAIYTHILRNKYGKCHLPLPPPLPPHTIVKNMRNKFVFLCKFANLRKNIRRFSIFSFIGPKFGLYLYYSPKKYWYLLADTLVTNWCEKFPKNDRHNRRRICVTFWPIFGGKIIKWVQFVFKKISHILLYF